MDLDSSGFNGRIDYSASGDLIINGNTYTVINSLGAEGSTTGTDLQGMNGDLAEYYALGADIDATATSGWSGVGFNPVGTNFIGTLQGLGHTIDGLFINRSGASDVGLFVSTKGASIANLGMINTDITAAGRAGLFAGRTQGGTSIIYSYATGELDATTNLGGLVGQSNDSNITHSYADVEINAASGRVGGLVGWATNTTISHSYAEGEVSGGAQTGGLVGISVSSNISQSFANVDIQSSDKEIGGLVGRLNGSIMQSYATGNVSSTGDDVGGLVGRNQSGNIDQSYATGEVTGNNHVGGLIGRFAGASTVNNSYWNRETSMQTSSAGLPDTSGLTSAEMMQMANFTGFDITDSGGGSTVWRIYEGQTTPLLTSFLTELTLTADDVTKTYDGNPFGAGDATVTGDTFKPGESVSDLLGSLTVSGTAFGAVNVGGYTITPSGLYSNQLGYDISFADGSLTIDPKALTLAVNAPANITYGTVTPTLTAAANADDGGDLVAGDTLAGLGITFDYGAATEGAVDDAGDYTFDITSITNSNYTLTGTTSNKFTIDPRGITITADDQSRTYGFGGTPADLGTTDFTITSGSLHGTDNIDAIALSTDATTSTGGYYEAGTWLLTPSAANFDVGLASNYDITYANAPTGLEIAQLPITVISITADDKAFDNTDTATISASSFDALLAGDDLTLAAIDATFDDAMVGTDKTVTLNSATLAGVDAANYDFTFASVTDLADITSVTPPPPSGGGGSNPSPQPPQPPQPPGPTEPTEPTEPVGPTTLGEPTTPAAPPTTGAVQPLTIPNTVLITSQKPVGFVRSQITSPSTETITGNMQETSTQSIATNVQELKADETSTNGSNNANIILQASEEDSVNKTKSILGGMIEIHPSLVKLFNLESNVKIF